MGTAQKGGVVIVADLQVRTTAQSGQAQIMGVLVAHPTLGLSHPDAVAPVMVAATVLPPTGDLPGEEIHPPKSTVNDIILVSRSIRALCMSIIDR